MDQASRNRPQAALRYLPRFKGGVASRGFTLIELVTVIILIGVLAAIAVPRYVALGTAARVAAVKQLSGVITETANTTRVLCKLNPACDYTSAAQALSIGGNPVQLNFGWIDSGDDSLNAIEINGWVIHDGFSASNPTTEKTLFTLDGSPDPATCSVTYYDAYLRGPVLGIDVVALTTGC